MTRSSSADSADLSVVGPSELGPFRIIDVIGKGGMGAVYRAYDRRLDRFVALKRLHRRCPRGESALQREARAAAQLSHPNIVQIYDFLESEGDHWIVMELVSGPTLRSLTENGPLGVKQTLRIAVDVTRGLAAAHQQGIVHSDLKTENIILDESGQAKILDFGLAEKLTQRDVSASSGAIRGTPRAMAPEQARGEAPTQRSDFFSLGVLLYECLSALSPFDRGQKNLVQTLTDVCSLLPKPLYLRSDSVPRELSDLVARLMAKDPEERPRDAEEILLTLSRLSYQSERVSKVLFVDDEPDVERLLGQWFRRDVGSGRLKIFFARDGVEALTILRADTSIQIIFTDLKMPRMNGLELIRELRQLRRPWVAVVLSAYGDLSNIRSAMNLGAFDFLTKPLDLNDLECTMAKAQAQLTEVQEHRRLKTENEFLDQRNRTIQGALNRHLESASEPSSDLLGGLSPADRQSIPCLRNQVRVLLEVAGVDQLLTGLGSAQNKSWILDAVSQVFELLNHHRGRVASVTPERVIFEIDHQGSWLPAYDQATQFADQLRLRVGEWSRQSRSMGGPALIPEIAVDPQSANSWPAGATLQSACPSSSLEDRTSNALPPAPKTGPEAGRDESDPAPPQTLKPGAVTYLEAASQLMASEPPASEPPASEPPASMQPALLRFDSSSPAPKDPAFEQPSPQRPRSKDLDRGHHASGDLGSRDLGSRDLGSRESAPHLVPESLDSACLGSGLSVSEPPVSGPWNPGPQVPAEKLRQPDLSDLARACGFGQASDFARAPVFEQASDPDRSPELLVALARRLSAEAAEAGLRRCPFLNDIETLGDGSQAWAELLARYGQRIHHGTDLKLA